MYHPTDRNKLGISFTKRTMIKLGFYKRGSIRPLSSIENFSNGLVIITCAMALTLTLAPYISSHGYAFNADKAIASLLSITLLFSLVNKVVTDVDWKKARKTRTRINRQFDEIKSTVKPMAEKTEATNQVYELQISELEDVLIRGGLLPEGEVSLNQDNSHELDNVVDICLTSSTGKMCGKSDTHTHLKSISR